MKDIKTQKAKEDSISISCHNVWKVFGATKEEFEQAGGPAMSDADLQSRGWTAAVRDASFDISTGEVFVIMGLSGSGKSTIVRCLSRLIEPTHGEILVEGTDLLAASLSELN
ncbi:MAG: ATP-binding cassette domain-containing protein, partial [Pseudomonadota bacterium]